eukprot:UN05670
MVHTVEIIGCLYEIKIQIDSIKVT